jgi:hypothetical protein
MSVARIPSASLIRSPHRRSQRDERPIGKLRPVLGGAEQSMGLVAVQAEVRVFVLGGRPAHAA